MSEPSVKKNIREKEIKHKTKLKKDLEMKNTKRRKKLNYVKRK